MFKFADGGYVDLANQLQTRNATIVELIIGMPDERQPMRTFSGTARRDPRDRPDPDIGYKLALGRALRTAARTLLKEANAAVREQEKERQRHLQASAEARARREERRLLPNVLAQKVLAEDETREFVITRDEWMERQYGPEGESSGATLMSKAIENHQRAAKDKAPKKPKKDKHAD